MSNHHPKEPETDTVVKRIDTERTNISASVMTWGAAIATAISCTYAAANWMNGVTARQDRIEETMTNEFHSLHVQLDNALSQMFTTGQHQDFAYRLQIQNPQLHVPLQYLAQPKALADDQLNNPTVKASP